MPMLFHCHFCDKPTPNRDGVCSDCKKKKGVLSGHLRNYKLDCSFPIHRGINVTTCSNE